MFLVITKYCAYIIVVLLPTARLPDVHFAGEDAGHEDVLQVEQRGVQAGVVQRGGRAAAHQVRRACHSRG